MNETDQLTNHKSAVLLDGEEWPGIDSRFRLIVVAALRTKQLLHGAVPRIEADPLKRRNTSIALEEVRQGLVSFTTTDKDEPKDGNGAQVKSDK
ncbi:MAG: DNA-directed RNA polymerase subunit omega [Pyrinomonadaceae bacterium]